MIVGVGVDTIEIRRVKKACEREHFQKRIFTSQEMEQFDANKVRAASDFAVKEAVSKVFGTGFSGFEPIDIEVLRGESGAPFVRLYRGAKQIAEEQGIHKIHVSITNTLEVATAFAVGVSNEGSE